MTEKPWVLVIGDVNVRLCRTEKQARRWLGGIDEDGDCLRCGVHIDEEYDAEHECTPAFMISIPVAVVRVEPNGTVYLNRWLGATSRRVK